MKNAFPALLRSLIEAKYPSRRAFIRAAEPDANESGSAGYLTRVLAGQRPPRWDRIEAWANALGLRGDERNHFLHLAALMHVPKQVRPMMEELYRQNLEFIRRKP